MFCSRRHLWCSCNWIMPASLKGNALLRELHLSASTGLQTCASPVLTTGMYGLSLLSVYSKVQCSQRDFLALAVYRSVVLINVAKQSQDECFTERSRKSCLGNNWLTLMPGYWLSNAVHTAWKLHFKKRFSLIWGNDRRKRQCDANNTCDYTDSSTEILEKI